MGLFNDKFINITSSQDKIARKVDDLYRKTVFSHQHTKVWLKIAPSQSMPRAHKLKPKQA
jgi:hypothetical protein